jgi:hypothetical protein
MAIKFNAKWNKSVTDIFKSFDKLAAESLSGQVDAVREGTFLIHEISTKSIQDNSSGTPQRRYSPKRTVLVSKPGDPPNTDTGRAVQSIKLDFQKAGLIGRVGTNLRYLRDLEFGTKNIAPRPWLSAAVKEASKEIAEIFRKAFKKSTEDSSK